ncbi:MAG: peptidoglycan recognition family protein [Phycisphaerae bacterium]
MRIVAAVVWMTLVVGSGCTIASVDRVPARPRGAPPVVAGSNRSYPEVSRRTQTARAGGRLLAGARPSRAASVTSWYPPGGRISDRWRAIVVHHSATSSGGAGVFDKYHRQKGWDELGYHFVIGNGHGTSDGFIEVGSRWRKQKRGAHCKTAGNYYNDHGIGICLVGDFTRQTPTPAQLASLERLVRFLRGACRIPLQAITTHRAVTHKTACPGRFFSLDRLRRRVAAPATASSLP